MRKEIKWSFLERLFLTGIYIEDIITTIAVTPLKQSHHLTYHLRKIEHHPGTILYHKGKKEDCYKCIEDIDFD